MIKSLNSDNGKEFKNETFEKLLKKNGINHYLSNKEDFAKNAIVERFNRTLRRIMIVDKEQNDARGPGLTCMEHTKSDHTRRLPYSDRLAKPRNPLRSPRICDSIGIQSCLHG